MAYAYSFDTKSISRIDYIQADVADAYTHFDDELELENEETEEEYFGHSLISINELSDNQLTEMGLI